MDTQGGFKERSLVISSLSAQFEKDKDVSAPHTRPRLRSKCANRFPHARTLIHALFSFWRFNNNLVVPG